ncbi:MAG TPA: pyridoxal phosphate-dependent aminotransferase [Verrucomicrobiae bacterium]|nr:pyridoxal phosphate-dependent aminotransferase [Verrucomicrobiae bacterium]
MFSSRFHWDARPNRLTQLLRGRRASGARILDLTESNPTQAGLCYPAAVGEAFADPRIMIYHPSPAGSIAARESVAHYYADRGHTVDPQHILLTASTSEAYAYLFKLLADPGDDVLVPRPSYPLFEFLADMESLRIIQYPLGYHGAWSIDMEALAAAITGRTRAIVVVNPNNPTGSFLKRGELAALADLAASRGLALISDEVFADYAFDPDPDRVPMAASQSACLAFSLSGLSKAGGLPQVKLGWMVCGGPEGLRREALEKLEWIADTYLSVGTPVQCAARHLLDLAEGVQQQIRDRTAENLLWAREKLAGTVASPLPVEGGWYLTLQVPRVRSEEEWALEVLARRDVLVQPGYFYDFETEAFLVVSLLTQPETFREGMSRLIETLGA